tara:strand:+ start:260 stop:433 length:174 start_codon:yes stop_codon:yes gene_type:complete
MFRFFLKYTKSGVEDTGRRCGLRHVVELFPVKEFSALQVWCGIGLLGARATQENDHQ